MSDKGLPYESNHPTPPTPLRLVWPPVNPQGRQDGFTEKELAEIISRARKTERMLIGRELHDNVNQILYTVRLFVEMLDATTEKDKNIHQKIVEYLRLAINEIRTISHEMVKGKSDEKGLVDNIRRIIDDIQLAARIRIDFKYSGEVENLSEDKKMTLLCIVQEQIKNIIQHSKANLVNLFISCNNNNISLFIKDNGVGFDPYLDHNGIGLPNIYQRVKAQHGVVALDTAKGRGCSLTITLPVC